MNEQELIAAITAKGEEIRVLKAAKPPTLKDDLAPLVNELLALKISYKNLTGEDFGGPAKEEDKKKKEPAAPQPEREGPSKAELNKLKRKENKAAKKAEARGDTETATPSESMKTTTTTGDDEEFAAFYGDAPLVQSGPVTQRVFRTIG